MNAFNILKNYNKINSKIKLLEIEVENMKMEIEEATDELKAQTLSDMPGGGSGKGSKTENICLSKENDNNKIKKLEHEIKREKNKLDYLDVKFKELNEREMIIIRVVFIQNKKDVDARNELNKYLLNTYNYSIGDRTYYNIKRSAIRKLA